MSEVMQRTDLADRRHDTVSAHLDVIRAIEPAVADNLSLLAPARQGVAATDYLPDLESASWQDEVECFRETAEAVSDELLVVLVGDMVTEEALPSYSMALNGLVRDEEGTGPAPWARWLRGWTAEENRHGDLLNAYLRLTGRVHMRAMERTVHALIANGFNPKSRADPYNLLVYTSFQERATRLSHSNVGRMAARDGDENLARICGVIAGDEARHEAFYTRMMGRGARTRSGGRHPRVPIDAPRHDRDARPVHGRRQGSRSVRSLRRSSPSAPTSTPCATTPPSSRTSSRRGTSQADR